MIRSMTGYGRSTLQEQDFSQTWEVRSVNSRFLDLKWRMPFYLRCLESRWEKILREYADRGRVDLSLQVQTGRPELLGISLNTAQARSMLLQVGDLAGDMGISFEPDFNRLLGIPSLWEDELREPDPAMTQSLEHGLRLALEDWNVSRQTEGQALAKDLGKRLIRLEEWLIQIRDRAPELKEEKFESLRSRIQAMLDRFEIEADRDRLVQEAAALSDRVDVTEEMTRLQAHLDRMAELLQQGGDAGKRLDFTLQECFREINTCGNKIQDAGVSRLVVDFKTELEKCREQVQNLE